MINIIFVYIYLLSYCTLHQKTLTNGPNTTTLNNTPFFTGTFQTRIRSRPIALWRTNKLTPHRTVSKCEFNFPAPEPEDVMCLTSICGGQPLFTGSRPLGASRSTTYPPPPHQYKKCLCSTYYPYCTVWNYLQDDMSVNQSHVNSLQLHYCCRLPVTIFCCSQMVGTNAKIRHNLEKIDVSETLGGKR